MSEEEFICFDDVDSIIFKTNYAKSSKLGGIALFSLDFDDFNGKYCMNAEFPLLRAAKETLRDPKENEDDKIAIQSKGNHVYDMEMVYF